MEQLYLTMGHEYLHAGFFALGKMNPALHHRAIRKWGYLQTKAWNFTNLSYYRYSRLLKVPDMGYRYSDLGFKILNEKPWITK